MLLVSPLGSSRIKRVPLCLIMVLLGTCSYGEVVGFRMKTGDPLKLIYFCVRGQQESGVNIELVFFLPQGASTWNPF